MTHEPRPRTRPVPPPLPPRRVPRAPLDEASASATIPLRPEDILDAMTAS